MSFFNLTIYGPQNKLKEYKLSADGQQSGEQAAKKTIQNARSIEEYHELKKKKMSAGK